MKVKLWTGSNANKEVTMGFEKGFKAYGSRDYQTALKEWLISADQGDAFAQINLGVMYANGKGVPENDIAGYMWFNLAASQGHAKGPQNKKILKGIMTPEQIAEANALTQKWREEHK